MTTIGLVMTTYNEEKVIKRCLESVLPFIDYYSIGVDEKTNDNTKKIIEETLVDKTGVVFDSPWNGFADARNQAFEQFKWDVDWFLIIDADMIISDEGFDKNKLNKNLSGYLVNLRQGLVNWHMNWLVNADYKWEWKGILHEFLNCSELINPITETLEGLVWIHGGDGGARPKDKAMFKRDVDVFLNEIIKESEPFMIQRYTFYLAQSYRDAGMTKESIMFYRIRGSMGGWNQEVYLSHYYAGKLSNQYEDFINALAVLPTRCDALVEILFMGVSQNNLELCSIGLQHYDRLLKEDISWDRQGLFFVDRVEELHDWAACAMGLVGRIDESKRAMLKLYDKYVYENDLHNSERIKNNLKLFLQQGF